MPPPTAPSAPRIEASYRTLARLAARFVPVWPATAGVVLVAVVRACFDLAPPTLMAYAIGVLDASHGAGGGLPGNYVELLWLLAALLLLRNLVFYGAQVAQAALAQGLENGLRHELFDKVLRLRFTYHDENRSGKTITRSLRDMEKARHFFREVAFGYLEMALLVLAILGLTFFAWHWSYGLVAVVTILPGIGLALGVGKRIAVMDREAWDRYDEVTVVLQENVAGARVVRAFGRENQESSKFGGNLGSFTRSWQGLSQYWTSRIPFIHTFFALGVPATLVVGVYRMLAGVGGLAEIVAVLLYIRTLRHRLRPLTRLVILGQEAAASAARVFEVLDGDDVIRSPEQPAQLPAKGGDLRLEGVHFAHPGTRVIHDLTLHVPAGGSLGILGPTGSGKSSLVHLLPRYYDPDEGRILLDGVDVRDLALRELRGEVGLVFQEPFLFSATVARNIAYGRPDASQERVEECAGLAAADDFVTDLPQGYETVVGERGVSLSGGQRQRLTIARALAMDPRVLVFDDATASVDAVTEKALFDGIRAAARGRTTLVISQRVTSVRWCDRVAVLEGGRLTGLGTHDELLATNDLYREIHAHQRITAAPEPREVRT